MQRSRKYLDKRKALGEAKKPLEPTAALTLLKSVSRDWESVDLDIRLGINTRKPDQNVRGTTVLPKGTGKTARVVVFCKEDKVAEAQEAGADHVGLGELLDRIQGGWVDFDICVATPDVMKDVSRVAKVLGPRGMMPNPKTGTVTNDIKQAIAEIKSGKVEYRADKTGIIHNSVGRASFSVDDLRENLHHLIVQILRAKPATVKGQYVKSISVSATQTPGVRIDPSHFSA
ncbi:50S ribosomal protein L1 [bacterium]|nr:50S ribosomal protein L1 [bacterium]